MKHKKISVNDLTDAQFEEIMNKASKKRDVPLLKTAQVNMRLSPDLLFIAKKLAKRAKKPVTTFLAELLGEDLNRLWKVVK
jgi:predicted DNA binding CopG/RHH family protein